MQRASCFIFLVLFFMGCENKKAEKNYDTPKNGTIHISVDESFKPVMMEQIKVYEASYPNTHIIASYKPEADCFKDLESDSTRMIIVTKGLNRKASDYYEQKISLRPLYDILAYDAVCAIVNTLSKDSVFTLEQIKQYLNGSDKNKSVVVDGRNATSTVRFLIDSVLKGGDFGSNVYAAANSKEAIEYVGKNENAIGFVGSSWISNTEDPEQIQFRKNVRLALLQCKRCDKDTFAKPSPATISYGYYPLVRALYFILKENRAGLGTGFVNYMSLERGQLVFRRSYLVPAKMNFRVRQTQIEIQQ